MPQPAYTRLPTDERRAQLLELAERLFTTHTYGELSMARIAREAGISKALLYHYFPSKQDFFRATLQGAIEDLVARTQVDEALPSAQQLAASLEAYLDWVDAHTGAYGKLMRTAMEEEWVRVLVDEVRNRTAERILEGITPPGGELPPAARTAVRSWLWFMDGACLDWIEHRDLDRQELLGLLLGTLLGALTAAGVQPPTG
ncbi:MAG: TetR/AcrR family transcriptional regulator [Solirubrobacteraceae bacterium]